VEGPRRQRSIVAATLAGMVGAGSFDCIVVGSGPGGATVARDLTRAGARVLIVERGGPEPLSGKARQAIRDLWWPGRSCFVSGSVLVLRGVTLGGSSSYFFGTAWPPPHDRLAVHGLDLRADSEALAAELGAAPLPRELMGPRAVALMDTARSLGFDWRPIPKFFDQTALRAGVPAHEARWSARRFVAEAVDGGAVLWTGARVERVLATGASGGVEVVAGGEHRTVRADRVVLAAGGLGTPPILRASGIDRAGSDWFYDPVTAVIGEVSGLDAGPELPMVGAADLVDSNGYMLTDLCRPLWLHRVLAVAAGRPDRVGDYRRMLSIMVKAKDELSGDMTGSRARLGKPLSPTDRERLRQGEADAQAILRHAGARHIYRTGWVAVHPGGTAKVGDIVDVNLETEIPGLYVCDASVIPMAWGRPPTLTVMSLGRRLARHLAGTPAPAVTP